LTPLVSVIMPAYNAELYIKEAIESILNQTFSDFEFIIYNDGSTDQTENIILSFIDARIKYERIEKNAGLVILLNKGLENAKGKFIARMDADDIALSNRLQEQFSYMEANPEVGICGSWYEFFGTMSGIVKTTYTNEGLQLGLFSGTPFGHPTIMMRNDLLKKYDLKYDNNFLFAEDYELFERASGKFLLANIPKVLLQYRKHNGQVTNQKWQKQYFLAGKIQARRLSRVLNNPTENDKSWMEHYFTETSIPSENWFTEIKTYKERLIADNKLHPVYPNDLFIRAIDNLFIEKKTRKNLYGYFFNKYYYQQKFNWSLLVSFFMEKSKPYEILGNKLTFLFIIKCLLFYRKKNLLPL
jgi:glycosyltransferase involved in cell wall biosynthesis